MVSNQTNNLDSVFSALSHPVRRAILLQCANGQQSVADLAGPHAISLNAISKHVKALEAAGLVSRQLDGNFHRIGTRVETLRPALDWMQHHVALWESSLLTLKSKLEDS